MTITEIQQFLQRCDGRIKQKFGVVGSQTENVLGSLTKVTEELGELAEQINKRRGRQRAEKGQFALEDLQDEVADVILAVSMLAVDLDFDLETALQHKISKVRKKLE